MKSIRYSSFLLIVLKRKKKRSHRPFQSQIDCFRSSHHVYVQFYRFFFLEILPIPSSHSSLPFFLFLTRSIYCDPPTTHPNPNLPNFDSQFISMINTFVYTLRADGARPSVSNYFLVGFLVTPSRKMTQGSQLFLISKKKRKTHFHSLPATCVLSCSKKSKKKKVKNIE